MVLTPELQLAWAAGLFEGEGTICVVNAKKKQYVKMQLASTDLDVITRFVDVMGVGKVRGPYTKNGSYGQRRKPIYMWAISRRSDVDKLVDRLWPFMCERRREQAMMAFASASVQTKVGSGVHDGDRTGRWEDHEREGEAPHWRTLAEQQSRQ